MSKRATLLTQEPLVNLLIFAFRRPANRCPCRKLFNIRPNHRNASTAHPFATPPTTSSSPPGNTDLNPTPTKPPMPGSNVPLRMLLDRNPDNLSQISRIPIPKGEREEKFTPSPLTRPLGLPHPPEPGQNSPVDRRTWSEKKADFADYNKAMERRRVLFRAFLRPYYQERQRLKHHEGKSFVGPERLFKKEKALWFPNIWGQTLRIEGDGFDGGTDLTPMLRGKISVVGIQSGHWAEDQVKTFVGEKANPSLKDTIERSQGKVQRVDVNVQSQTSHSLLVRLFKWRLRRSLPESQWGKYFMVKLVRDVGKGLTEDIRDAMGFLNSQVGYVYLLDRDCKIRWAGSGSAWTGEVESLNAGIARLIEAEYREPKANTGKVR